MTLLSPSENSKIEHSMGMVRISTPGRKDAKQLFLLGTWVGFCLLLLTWMLVIGYQMTIGADKAFDVSSICLLLPLTLAMLVFMMWGVFAAYLFFWQFGGLETIEVSHNLLRIRRSVFGIGRTRIYESDRIKSIRLGTETKLPIAFLRFKFAQFEVPASGQI